MGELPALGLKVVKPLDPNTTTATTTNTTTTTTTTNNNNKHDMTTKTYSTVNKPLDPKTEDIWHGL